MIYSPRTLLLRDDEGNWKEPVEVDILVSPAVNAGVVRRDLRNAGKTDESNIETTMRERMGRILYLFETRGVRNIVLGSFGTGVFRNKVDLVANLWIELLVGDEARFAHSFDQVLFAVIGTATFQTFQTIFAEHVLSVDL